MSSEGGFGSGLCLWFTGRPSAGKTTIALQLARTWEAQGVRVSVLDADAVRPILCPDLGYSREDRFQNLSRLAFVARELVRHGAVVLVVTITPFEEDRRWLRGQFSRECFAQVYVKATLEECERRDVKGMYRKARDGQLPDFTGIQSPFDEPSCCEITCDTQAQDIDDCVIHILNEATKRAWLQQRASPSPLECEHDDQPVVVGRRSFSRLLRTYYSTVTLFAKLRG